MRLALRLILAAAVLLALILGALEAYLLTLPPLVRAVVWDTRAAESVFNARVQSAFPIGLPEAELRRELERQGFETRHTHTATRKLASHFVCGAHWVVFWETDEAGTLAKVSGRRWVKSL
jgi:hypothetical protein